VEAGGAAVAAQQIAALLAGVAVVVVMAPSRPPVVRMLRVGAPLNQLLVLVGRRADELLDLLREEKGVGGGCVR